LNKSADLKYQHWKFAHEYGGCIHEAGFEFTSDGNTFKRRSKSCLDWIIWRVETTLTAKKVSIGFSDHDAVTWTCEEK
jgi:hypothetical protein